MWSYCHIIARRLGFMCFEEIFPFSVNFDADFVAKDI